MTAAESGDVPGRPVHLTATWPGHALGSVPGDWDAVRAVTALYAVH
jgi:hypothetical protein